VRPIHYGVYASRTSLTEDSFPDMIREMFVRSRLLIIVTCVALLALIAGLGVPYLQARSRLKDGEVVTVDGTVIGSRFTEDCSRGEVGCGELYPVYRLRLAYGLEVDLQLPEEHPDTGPGDPNNQAAQLVLSRSLIGLTVGEPLDGKKLEIRGTYRSDISQVEIGNQGDYVKRL